MNILNCSFFALKPNRAAFFTILLMALLSPASQAFAQGSTFTYQGQLKDAGSPVNGAYDMTFRLFDSDVGGIQIGIDFPLPATAVTNGLFTVMLDIVGATFDGNPRWLEIEVNGVVLTPRQALTAAPYAQFSPNAYNSTISGHANTAGYAYGPWSGVNTDLYFLGGKVGIGTDTPMALLHLGGTAGVDGIMFPDGTLQTTAAIGGGGSIWSLNGTNAYYNAGRVGIGTNLPSSQLDITAIGDGAEVLRLSTERPWVFRQSGTGSVARLQMRPLTGLKFFDITGPAGGPVASFFSDETDPRVGIGTTNPLSKLDIAATGDGAELLRFSTERPWVFRQIYSGPSTGLQLLSTSGLKNFEITAFNGANVATFLTDSVNPRVGIGTTTPVSKLDIVGQDAINITGFQPFITLRDTNSGGIRARIQNTFADIHFFTEASFANGIPMMSIRNNGTTSVKVLEIRGGADFSEQFDVSGSVDENDSAPSSTTDIQPGMVVSIDSARPGKLVVSSHAYDRRVAGIISGAGGVSTGMLMGQEGSIADGLHPVALSGRVYAMCDAERAAIEPGDLLTTSDSPGCAMKATDRERTPGAVLGKAMTELKKGKGLVLVLVTLQ